jgi:hypothetical protein
MEFRIDPEKKTLTLVLQLQELTPSASGKTLVSRVHARQPIDGKELVVGVNAYLR